MPTRYRVLLTSLSKSPSAELTLANLDLDTGARVVPGTYKLTDQAYAELLDKIAQQPADPIPAGSPRRPGGVRLG